MAFSLVGRGGAIRSQYLDHGNVRSAIDSSLDIGSRLVIDPKQSARFVKAAKELGLGNAASGVAFERAIDTLTRSKKGRYN
jgi:hypothetical protein